MAGANGAIKLVPGNSNPRLVEAVAARLRTPPAKGGGAALRRYGNLRRDLENVRGADVFVIQSTSYPPMIT